MKASFSDHDTPHVAARGNTPFPSLGRLLFSGQPDSPLKRAVEALVVPRLIDENLRDAPLPFKPARPLNVSPGQLSAFAALAVNHDINGMLLLIDRVTGESIGFTTLLEGLFVPAARLLGEEWLADRRSFAEVSLGVSSLQQVLSSLALPIEPLTALNDFRVAFAAVPGERHSFAASMLAEVFRTSGWHADVLNCNDLQELADYVAADSYDVIGLSLARCELRARLSEAVALIRRVSRNPAVSILVGGPVFDANPEWLALTGADGTATTAAEAVAKATDLAKLARQGVSPAGFTAKST
jgi:MerR family transcriptional regulator, light-induced transcriptional regulator